MVNELTPGEKLFAELDIDMDEVAIEHLHHYTAVEYYLTVEDEPPVEATNLEKAQCYLECFYHLYDAQDWNKAKMIVTSRSITPSGKEFHEQLNIWSLPEEQIALCKKLLWKVDNQANAAFLCSLGIAYDDLGDYEESIKHYKLLLEQGYDLNLSNEEYRADALGGLGNVYQSLGEYHKAIEYHTKALQLNTKNYELRGVISNTHNLGNAYVGLGEINKAIEFCECALNSALVLGDRRSEAGANQTLGICYSVLGQSKKAIEYFETAVKMFQEIGDRKNEASIYNELGVACKHIGEYQLAISFQKKSLTICKELNHLQGISTTLGNLGNVYRHINDYETAILYHQEALEICRSIGDRDGEARALFNIGNVYGQSGNPHLDWLFSMKAILIYDSLKVTGKVKHLLTKFSNISGLFKAFSTSGDANDYMFKKQVIRAIIKTLFGEDYLSLVKLELGEDGFDRVLSLIVEHL